MCEYWGERYCGGERHTKSLCGESQAITLARARIQLSPAAARYFSSLLGLSLTVLLPAAAWYFVFIVGHFLPRPGQKNDPQGVEPDRQVKVLFMWVVFSPVGEKRPTKREQPW
jgi:hypothetical protein